jgi:hypothetical protein
VLVAVPRSSWAGLCSEAPFHACALRPARLRWLVGSRARGLFPAGSWWEATPSGGGAGSAHVLAPERRPTGHAPARWLPVACVRGEAAPARSGLRGCAWAVVGRRPQAPAPEHARHLRGSGGSRAVPMAAPAARPHPRLRRDLVSVLAASAARSSGPVPRRSAGLRGCWPGSSVGMMHTRLQDGGHWCACSSSGWHRFSASRLFCGERRQGLPCIALVVSGGGR